MPAIPTREPLSIVAGATVKWRREDLTADYPASAGWALSYNLVKASRQFTISAVASGDAFQVDLSASATAQFETGRYAWQAFVTKTTEIYPVGSGQIDILPNLSSPADVRSHARKMLEAIEAVLENRATLEQKSYEIAGRRLERVPPAELVKLHAHYDAIVKSEDAAAALNAGRKVKRKILTRFMAPSA